MKIRMQINGAGFQKKVYSSTIDGIKKTYNNEGLLAFYNGLTAVWIRQAASTSARFGVYTTLFKILSNDDTPPTFTFKVMSGMLAGMFGGFIGTPINICLVRMVTDGVKPQNEKFNYRNIFEAFYKIAKYEGGTRALWRGGTATILRGVIYNGVSFSTYSQTKQELLEKNICQDKMLLHFNAAVVAGLASTILTLPVDLVKTRMQSSAENSGVFKIFVEIFKKEGFLAYWKGFAPFFIRVVPYTILSLVVVEQLTLIYSIYFLRNTRGERHL